MKHVRVSQMNLAVEMWLCNMWLCLLGFDVPYLTRVAASVDNHLASFGQSLRKSY